MIRGYEYHLVVQQCHRNNPDGVTNMAEIEGTRYRICLLVQLQTIYPFLGMKCPDISKIINLHKSCRFGITLNPGIESPFASGIFPEGDNTCICALHQVLPEWPDGPSSGNI